jgi:retinol dehydrogenase-12
MSALDLLTFMPVFFYNQWFAHLPEQTASFAGKTIIVTGASNGLGLEAARLFAQLGASKVILAVRNIEKGEKVKKDIATTTACKGDVLEVWQLDLASHESVKEFAKKAKKELERIDVLVNNAGINVLDFKLVDGDEETITVNVISSFLLAGLLLPKMKETATKFNVQPRLVVISSELHLISSLPERNDKGGSILAALRDKSTARMRDRYSISKLLEMFMVRQLAENWKAKGKNQIIVNGVNPGMASTDLATEMVPGLVLAIVRFVFASRTTAYSARTLVDGAVKGEESQGEYLSDCHVTLSSRFVRSEEGRKTQKRVWEEVMARLDEIEPGVSKNF